MRNICWCPCLNSWLNFDPWRNYAAYFTVILPNLDHYEINNVVLDTSFETIFRNNTPPKSQTFTLKRMSSEGDIPYNKTDKFPGFRIKWHYSKELTPNRYSATEELLGGCKSKWLCNHVNPSLDRLGVKTYYYTYRLNPSNVLFNKYKLLLWV